MASSDEVDIEYVVEKPDENDQLYQSFAHVFSKFSSHNLSVAGQPDQQQRNDQQLALSECQADEEGQATSNKLATKTQEAQENEEKKTSHRRVKQLTRISVAELKQQVDRPELVELHDVTAKDPLFLLHLKSTKNSVPVPRHWSSKRRYLQGKRGYEKPPFQLPEFIRQTGIMEMRDSVQDKETNKSLKAKTRDRVQPKMGKIQMDYQQLHDAFFKWQTKPKLTIHGDLYYEGKEFEKRFKKKPGELSNELRKALGMPTGPNAYRYPPPWLQAMKRHGPPPAYPYLQIPGVNCPFPDAAEE